MADSHHNGKPSEEDVITSGYEITGISRCNIANTTNHVEVDGVASEMDAHPMCPILTWNWLTTFYLCMFSVFGTTIRVFMGRFFGGDCDSLVSIDDWLTPLSRRICITASGTTNQYGGALFIDLPANIFGSLIMGFVTGHSKDWSALPWLKYNHPLQRDIGLHLGIRTGLCGTITTFSSWNSQMVLMIDGSANRFLTSQIPAALFGYLIGLQVCVTSFRGGRTLSAWLHFRNNPQIFETEYSQGNSFEIHPSQSWLHLFYAIILPAFVVIIIFTLYLLGDFYWGILYYRELWLSCLVGPFGTILRWKLSTLNGKIKIKNMYWFPFGTFLANIIAVIISAVTNAVVVSSLLEESSWALSSCKAMSLGFAGCLSTVSTMVKEVVDISEKNPLFSYKAFIYSFGTLLCSCIMGLAFYSPIVHII